MIIKVTEEDIKLGVKEDSCKCPVALAMRRITKKQCSVGIAWITVISLNPYSDKTYFVPKKVENFIAAFDKGEKVEPFEFELSKAI